jgi:hypothetical protein
MEVRYELWRAAYDDPEKAAQAGFDIAADRWREQQRLRELLARYRDETPLGHQPHMIAHLVDEALGRVPNKQ